jgi:nicotinamide-nucleotide amidase
LTLADEGAVSEAVVLEMAEGAVANSHADLTVAISGIAGPDGGLPGKPVGTVCFAWLVRDGFREAQTCRFEGDREAVRRQSVQHAMQHLLKLLGNG